MTALRQTRLVDVRNQTAGRNALGNFAPTFAEINDDVLFGQVWARELELSPRDRSMITVASLISSGNFGQVPFHMNFGRQNGLTRTEVSEMITHLSFYVGWPKAWSAFGIAQGIFTEEEPHTPVSRGVFHPFPIGERITNPFFQGDTWLYMLVHPASPHNTGIGNVTFSPGARNNWHSHEVAQFLLVTYGTGFYQEYGQPARLLRAGDVVYIPSGVRHWHGAAPDDWFVHIAVTPGATSWYEALTDAHYTAATSASMAALRQGRTDVRNQTAGRNALGAFAPTFAGVNDDILFAQVWAREAEMSLRDRSMITITAIISTGNFAQLAFHTLHG
jgi:alkylhydroperoxidase/carboxymuconolactone decarboxylase family protein YurZ/quercetin dioxygenase-like cupin family protein